LVAKICHRCIFKVSFGYPKTKTPLLFFEKQGHLCSRHGNLSVKVSTLLLILKIIIASSDCQIKTYLILKGYEWLLILNWPLKIINRLLNFGLLFTHFEHNIKPFWATTFLGSDRRLLSKFNRLMHDSCIAPTQTAGGFISENHETMD
jgi:hypothetical protein